jgi:beta-RFAP synthase
MSVARALAACVGRADMPAEALARRVGRGARSAIGIHGFQLGGFIVEGGKEHNSHVAPLVARLTFPEEWHFLLISDNTKGRYGQAEREAFDTFTPISRATTAELCRLTLLGMLPAIAERNFDAFSQSLAEFGRMVGECFAAYQGGVYGSPVAQTATEALARHGVRGVAQSSWGPTLAAVCESKFRAEWTAARLADSLPDSTRILNATANNLGAKIEIVRTSARLAKP